MVKERVKIPRAIKEKVLKEFNHSCAICNKSNPQMHHIDEDPSNNSEDNLLPLCPNHHLTDQHNPTAKIDQQKLQLFRDYKDPVILSPQFDPLFQRFRFLINLNSQTPDLFLLQEAIDDLISFVLELKMGGYYGKTLRILLGNRRAKVGAITQISKAESDRHDITDAMERLPRIQKCTNQVVRLMVELLRYQDWHPEPNESL